MGRWKQERAEGPGVTLDAEATADPSQAQSAHLCVPAQQPAECPGKYLN